MATLIRSSANAKVDCRTRPSWSPTEAVRIARETSVTNRSQTHNSGRVRRTSREESGAQTAVSRSKPVRLISAARLPTRSGAVDIRRHHKMS